MVNKPKGGDPKKRAEAEAKIEVIQSQIANLWDEAARIADKACVSFYYGPPDDRDTGGGKYYPKRPKDWVVISEYHHDGEDPNEDHPEHESYHPWNEETCDTEYDWSSGNWISSSSRC